VIRKELKDTGQRIQKDLKIGKRILDEAKARAAENGTVIEVIAVHKNGFNRSVYVHPDGRVTKAPL
jgi:hypothetical protein